MPIQQLANFAEEDSQMPSYVRQIIESGMKTLSIADYPVPKFSLGKATEDELAEYATAQALSSSKDDEDEDEAEVPEVAEPEAEPAENEDQTEQELDELITEPSLDNEELAIELPQPEAPSTAAVTATIVAAPPLAETLPAPAPISATTESLDADSPTSSEIENAVSEAQETEHEPSDDIIVRRITPQKTLETEAPVVLPAQPTSTDVDLSQFAHPDSHTNQKDSERPLELPIAHGPVIKHSSGVGNMLKMIFITIAVFLATVAIGVGVGLGILQLSNRGGNVETSPVVAESPTPEPVVIESPSPSPEASPAATLNKEELSILVVNATTKPGYAGTTRSKLVTAGYGTVTAGNARDKYDPGTYVLLSNENQSLVSALEEDSGLELDVKTDDSVENPNDQYDAVIVLAE